MIGIEEGDPVTCIRFAGGMTGGSDEQQGGGKAMSENGCGVRAKRGSPPASGFKRFSTSQTLFQ